MSSTEGNKGNTSGQALVLRKPSGKAAGPLGKRLLTAVHASGDPAEAFAAARCAELSVIDVGTRSDHWFPSRLCSDSHSSSTERTGRPETQTQILAVPLGALSQAFHYTQSSQLPRFSLWGGRMQGRGNIVCKLQRAVSI